MAREELPQVFARFAQELVVAKQAFDRLRDLARRAAVSDGPCNRLVLADGAADAEVIRVDQLAVLLDFLAFKTEVGDPVLAATVRASRDMQLQVLLEARQALIQLFCEPARERLGLGDGDLAELSTGAGDDAAAKWRAFDRQSCQRQAVSDMGNMLPWHIGDQQVLHVGGAELTSGVAFAKVGGGA